MLKQLLITVLLSTFPLYSFHAQVISSFDWDNPLASPLTATVGASGINLSNGAIIAPGGVNGSTGLAPGTGNLNFDLPQSASMDVDGIDVSIAFLRREKKAYFLSRSGFEFGISGGSLFVKFTVEDGYGGSYLVNSGSQFLVPQDGVWRTFRFYYLPDVGMAEISVDGAPVWTYAGMPNRNLVWQSDNFKLGRFANGTSSTDVIFDNFTFGQVGASALPVELTNFSISMQNVSQVDLSWTTATEINNERFDIQKSNDGVSWETIGRKQGAGNSQEVLHYTFTDFDAHAPVQYYRLRQIDLDGQENISAIVSYTRSDQMDLKIFPNPTKRYIFIEAHDLDFTVIRIADMNGRYLDIDLEEISYNKKRIDLSAFPSGSYLLHVGEVTNHIKLI